MYGWMKMEILCFNPYPAYFWGMIIAAVFMMLDRKLVESILIQTEKNFTKYQT